MAIQAARQDARVALRAHLAWSRSPHALIFAGALLVFILGASMSLEPQGRVSLPGFGGRPLPTLCVSRQFGFECATCGVTRSIIALLHGSWTESVRLHRFGWLIFVVIFSQIPYRACRVFRPSARSPVVEACGAALLVLTFTLVLVNWLLGLCGLISNL